MTVSALVPDIESSTMTRPIPHRTGMEPFLDFCSALIYAFTQIRIEWEAYKQYQRTIPQESKL